MLNLRVPWYAGLALLVFSTVLAEGPLILKRTLVSPDGREANPTGADFNHDGIQEIMAHSANVVQILNGLNGQVIASYTGETGAVNSFGWAMETLRDVDGDGVGDFMISAPFQTVDGKESSGAVYGLRGGSASGVVSSLSLLFKASCDPPCGLGASLGATSELAILGGSRVIVLEPRNGAPLARLTGPDSFGFSVAGIGDIDGDGVEDIAIGGTSGYVVSGAARTETWLDVTSPDFKSYLICKLLPTDGTGIGVSPGFGDHEGFANLNDPAPADGIREQLIACSQMGQGLIAFVIRKDGDGGFSARPVASSASQGGVITSAVDLVNAGDCNGDAVADLAVFDSEFKDGEGNLLGRIVLVSGLGLLDGFDAGDVIQDVRGAPHLLFHGTMRGMGDYDGDGLQELLVTGIDERLGTNFFKIYTIVPSQGSLSDCNGNGVADVEDMKPQPLVFALPTGGTAAGDLPKRLVLGDFDGDGRLDFATANVFSRDVSIRLRAADGTVLTSSDEPVADGPNDLVAVDVDGDDDLDIVTANYGTFDALGVRTPGKTISLLRNRGDGSFDPAVNIEVPESPFVISAADLDGDRNTDLVVLTKQVLKTGEDASLVVILRNRNKGSFEVVESHGTGATPFSLTTADLDGVRGPDIAVIVDQDVKIFLNIGDGRFAPGGTFFSGNGPKTILPADVDGDGDLDLAVSDDLIYGVSILRNKGDATFEDSVWTQAGNGSPAGLAIADADMDGDVELITAARSALDGVWVFRNNGAGLFSEIARFPNIGDPISVAARDLDGDGDPDVAVTDGTYDEVDVYENKTQPPTSRDCNQNGQPDECDIASAKSADCNHNGVPDECDSHAGHDRDGNGIPDECELPRFHRGDTNGDGDLDIADAIFTLRYLFSALLEVSCMEAADYNNDGEVNISDPIASLGFLFLGRPPPAPPGPPESACGTDSDTLGSRGDLGCERYSHCTGV